MVRRPPLHAKMRIEDFRALYWMKAELAEFARALGLTSSGDKPTLARRIDRHLRGRPVRDVVPPARPTRRDSDARITRRTPVVAYWSDDRTRAFFVSQIGNDFHFTWHLNQFRIANPGLTYGDLVDEWLAERERRRSPGYRAPIAAHGKWNRFVRDFFADPNNAGRTLTDAARAWRVVKAGRGHHEYRPRRQRAQRP